MSVFGAGSGAIGTGIVYSLVDQFSKPADQVMAKFQKLEGVTDQATANINKSFEKIKMGGAMLAASGAFLLPLGKAIDEAAEFERQFVAIKRTVKMTSAEYDDLNMKLREAATHGGATLETLTEGAQLAAKMGAEGNENIIKFSKNVARFSSLTDISMTEAATNFKRIAQIMQVPLSEIENMGSAVVQLGDSFSAADSDILGFSTKIAEAAKMSGMGVGDILGLAAAFVSVGADSGRGANAVAKTFFKMNDAVNISGENIADFAELAGMSVKQFSDTFRNDPVQAFNAFVQGLGKSGNKAAALMDELELSDMRLKNMFIAVAGAGGNMGKAIAEANMEYAKGTALAEESAMKYATVSGQAKILSNNIREVSLTVGTMFLPIMKLLNQAMTQVIRAFNWLSKSPVGQFIIGLTAAVATLVGAIGTFIIVTNLARFAAAKASISFAQLGMTEVATAFATGGLTAGMGALAAAAWAAMAPFLPFIAVAAAVAGIVWGLVKASNMYSDVLEGKAIPATEGWRKTMQQIGGIMQGTVEVFRTASAEGFSMSEKMQKSLKELGVLDTVIALGTWAVRLKVMFGGIRDGLLEVWGVIKTAWNYLKMPFQWLSKVFSSLGFDIDKLTSKLSTWIEVGKWIGRVIGTLITIALAPLAIIIATVVFAVEAVTAALLGLWWAIEKVIWFFTHLGEVVDWVGEKWGQFVNWLTGLWTGFTDWVSGLAESAWNWGVNFVTNLWEGIKSVWQSVKDWFASAVEALLAPFKWVLTSLGLMDDVEVNTTTTAPVSSVPSPMGASVGKAKANAAGGSTETYTFNKESEVVKDIYVTLPDGRVLAKVVNAENDSSRIRKGA